MSDAANPATWRDRLRALPGFCRGVTAPLGRAVVGTYNEGFIHAGNLAYLSLISLFPFFIAATFIAGALGRGEVGPEAVEAVLATMPGSVAEVVRQPAYDVLNARAGGSLLWIGAIVGLWTVASLIETVRDILRRAYSTQFARSFWQYRLGSIGMIILAVVLMMISFSAEVVLVAVAEFVDRFAPRLDDAVGALGLSRYAPLLGLFIAIYTLFLALTPAKFRGRRYPKWPGALLTALWWVATLWALPLALAYFFSYDRTYGSLAGVMIALLFFYVVGLGLVMGAEYNAALAQQADACESEVEAE